MIHGISAVWLPVSDMQRAVAFAVDDIEATIKQLTDLGVAFTGELSEHPWGRIAPFTDQDGNDLQVYAPPSGS